MIAFCYMVFNIQKLFLRIVGRHFFNILVLNDLIILAIDLL